MLLSQSNSKHGLQSESFGLGHVTLTEANTYIYIYETQLVLPQ